MTELDLLLKMKQCEQQQFKHSIVEKFIVIERNQQWFLINTLTHLISIILQNFRNYLDIQNNGYKTSNSSRWLDWFRWL